MFFSLLSLLFKARKTNILPVLSILMTFIATLLLVILCFACHKPESTFSEIYTIETVTSGNGKAMRAGYFYMCELPNSIGGNHNGTAPAGTPVCHRNSYFKGTDLAYMFARHVSRPYFLIVSTVLCLLAGISAVGAVLVSRTLAKKINFTLTSLSMVFTLVTACWQQIAVHAAVILVPQEVKKGHRAAGMVWSAVALQLLAILSIVVSHKKDQHENRVVPPSVGSSGGSSVDSQNTETKIPFENPFLDPKSV